MRSENQMLAQIIAFATADVRVRAVLLNGSRVNPTHTPDLLSDYDVLLSVTDVESFVADEGWLAHFGDVLIMQRPTNPPPQHAWLVIFADGVRVDFTLSPTTQIAHDAAADSLTRMLLDKDAICPPLEAPSERTHWVALPNGATFAECCNEFWWVLLYAAKGLWRGQLLYAKQTFDCIVRPELERMLTWHAVALAGQPFNPGAYNKHLPRMLTAAVWEKYVRTFVGAEMDANWGALEVAASLMAQIAPQVAEAAGCTYDTVEGENALHFMRALRDMEP
jgi:aminoglycoside 6-adenylyltransferase